MLRLSNVFNYVLVNYHDISESNFNGKGLKL